MIAVVVTVLQWLAGPIVRWGAVALGVLAIGSLWLWRHDAKVAHKAERAVIERSEDAGRKAEAKADRAHRAARRPGAAERVMRNYCRDC